MKNKFKYTIKKHLVVVFLLLTGYVQATEPGPPGFEDDVADVPAPINDWIIPAMVLITLLMFFYFRNLQKKQQF